MGARDLGIPGDGQVPVGTATDGHALALGGEHEDVLALLGVLPVDEGKPAAFGREQLLELDRHALLVGDVRLRLTHGRYLSV